MQAAHSESDEGNTEGGKDNSVSGERAYEIGMWVKEGMMLVIEVERWLDNVDSYWGG